MCFSQIATKITLVLGPFLCPFFRWPWPEMGNVCPRRVSDTVRQEQINSRDAVCTVSPRNRQHVWDVPGGRVHLWFWCPIWHFGRPKTYKSRILRDPFLLWCVLRFRFPSGVNIHCPLCDDVLFSTPLDLAAGLLDFLLDHRCEGHHSYTIAARIHSAVCLSAALGRATDLPELVYQKITKLLGQSGKTNALEILQEATLLHSKFLLELCFGCNAAPMPSRLALRLFSAMQVADDLKIWNIVEAIKTSTVGPSSFKISSTWGVKDVSWLKSALGAADPNLVMFRSYVLWWRGQAVLFAKLNTMRHVTC